MDTLIHQPSRVNTRDHLSASAGTIWVYGSNSMSPRDRERYSRQILFAGIGEQGQQHLLDARVAVAGCGALGSFQAGALARAGVGFVRIIDRDYVELSNLQRQWLFDESDVEQGLPKAVAAARNIASVNSDVCIEPVVADLTASNVEDLLGDVDLVLDGTDNFETRYLINDFAVDRSRPPCSLDLWRGRGQLWNRDGRDAGRECLPAVHLSRSAGRRATHLRDGGRVGPRNGGDREPAGSRGDQDSVRRWGYRARSPPWTFGAARSGKWRSLGRLRIARPAGGVSFLIWPVSAVRR